MQLFEHESNANMYISSKLKVNHAIVNCMHIMCVYRCNHLQFHRIAFKIISKQAMRVSFKFRSSCWACLSLSLSVCSLISKLINFTISCIILANYFKHSPAQFVSLSTTTTFLFVSFSSKTSQFFSSRFSNFHFYSKCVIEYKRFYNTDPVYYVYTV